MQDVERLHKLMTGADPANSQRENASVPPGSITFGSTDTLAELMRRLEDEKRQAVDRARAIDVTDTRNE
jgi:hypothetical protein